jgi:hypothetical protein
MESVWLGPGVITAHYRDGDVHVRGCWVVDLLTGRQ